MSAMIQSPCLDPMPLATETDIIEGTSERKPKLPKPPSVPAGPDELVDAATALCDLFERRCLVIVQSPDCFAKSGSTFVVGEFLLTGWLSKAAGAGPRIRLRGNVTAEVAVQFADALERLPRTFDDELSDALSGDSTGGLAAFCHFLRGGGFVLVEGDGPIPQ